PGSVFEWLGNAVFSCSRCHRWRCETDYKVLDKEGAILLEPKYICGHCRKPFDGDKSTKEHCGACGVESEWGVNCVVSDVMWD
ncbi:hypothetical protein OAA91_00720, partial [Fibrobacterales bacterium]|nr:hypothetical protein [Fibrobacterales bacterium]